MLAIVLSAVHARAADEDPIVAEAKKNVAERSGPQTV
jgi:hypothetical protein